jgi:NAD(P)-dependent dehydrogenase (short-subunit alcohol dehydrogenase family)
LDTVREKILKQHPDVKIGTYPVDIQDYSLVDAAIESAISDIGHIDILINNVRIVLMIIRVMLLSPIMSQPALIFYREEFC